jgi:hypothetical protein
VFNQPRSSVSQNAINDNNYSFDILQRTTKPYPIIKLLLWLEIPSIKNTAMG